jgi:Beta-propeller repeat/Viral BACON domain/Putative binding domain, N-terminal
MLSSRSRTKCSLAFLIGLSSVMLGIGSISQRLGSLTAPIFKAEAVTGGELKAPPNFPQRSPLNDVDTRTRERLSDAYGKLPLSFEANDGQVDSRVKFISRTGTHTLFLTSSEVVLMLRSPCRPARPEGPILASVLDRQPAETVESKGAVLRMKLVGANPVAKVIGLDELPGKSNYFIGNDPKKWRVNVATYARVKYEHVYRGIDLVYYGNHRQLEYDLIVAPGADPKRICFAVAGVDDLRIDKMGDLVFSTVAGEVRQQKPRVYQLLNGSKKTIPGKYVRKGERVVGFELGAYDPSQPLVIDPILSYSTFLGGSNNDSGSCIAVDSAGNAYVAGNTGSFDFPTAKPLQTFIPLSDAFITKLNAAGTALVYSTYVGGNDSDPLNGIATDASGNVYVIGYTFSSNFPTKNPLQAALLGGQDAFVTKINAMGSALVYSTYLGGSGGEWGLGIAVDDTGNAYLSGATFSTDFPTVNPIQSTSSGVIAGDAFVAKLNPLGSALVYSTYLGGYGEEAAEKIAVDSSGSAYVTGYTRSPNFPTANPIQPAFAGPCFKSSDGASTWNSINNGFGSWGAPALAISPSNPTTVYAAGERGSGIFKSTDSGDNWFPINNGLVTSSPVTALAVDPADSSTVYAALSSTVIKSTNAGASWSFSGVGISSTIVCFAIDPVKPSTLYAGASTSNPKSAFKSTNGGATWMEINNGLPNHGITSFAIDPSSTAVLYAGSDSRAYKSTNGGDSWAAIFFSSSGITPLAIDPSNTSTIYLGAGNGVLKSTNGGTSFSLSGPGITGAVNTLVIDPLSPSTLYAGRSFGGGIYKTTNAGASWIAMSAGLTVPNIKALAINPLAPSTLYVGTSSLTDAFVAKLNASGSALVYSTYLGGSFDDIAFGIAVDSLGNAYVTGLAISSDFPTVSALQTTFGGDVDAFVTKINTSGSALVFSTFLGGDRNDQGSSIALDGFRNIYIAGFTQSTNFPISDAIQSSLSGSDDIFVAKLSETGSALIYSTYLGGSGLDRASGIAVDSVGSAYVAGVTGSTNFPISNGAFQTNFGGGSYDSFVTKIVSPCAYSLSRTSLAFPSTGGSGSVDLSTAISCAWTAVSNDNWVFVTSADSGNGNATITFELRENFDERFRIGTLTIGGQTFTVFQEGLGSSGCSNAISPTFGSFPSIGGSGSVNVIANEECIWTAVSNTSWVTITSNENGIGVGVVTYSVGANAGTASRKGTITIAGQTFAIKQKGNVGASHGSGGGKP